MHCNHGKVRPGPGVMVTPHDCQAEFADYSLASRPIYSHDTGTVFFAATGCLGAVVKRSHHMLAMCVCSHHFNSQVLKKQNVS